MGRSTIDWSSLNPQRLAPQIVDDEARAHPDSVLAEIPVSATTFEDGFRTLTYQDVSNAVNGIALWLHDNLGPGQNFETLTYYGVNDYMHMLLILATIKAGYKMFFPPPRETPQGQARMLEIAGCSKILIAESVPIVGLIQKNVPNVQVISIPKASHFLHGATFAHYPYEKTFEEAQDDPFVVLPTSGTTGLPKTIVWSHRYISRFAAERYLTPTPGYERMDEWMMGNRMFTLGLPVHASGVWTLLVYPLYCKNVCVLPPAASTLSASLGVQGSIASKAEIAIFLPFIMEQLAHDPDLIDQMADKSPQTVIFYGGGVISHAAGEAISPRIRIFNQVGSTESGIWPCLRREGEWDHRVWNCLLPNPACGLELRRVSETAHEAIFVRQPDPTLLQPCFTVFPTAQEVATGDLFTPASGPGQEGLWVYAGRREDLQRLLGGDHFNATSTEHEILRLCKGSELQNVLIVCNDLPHAVLLLELSEMPEASGISQEARRIGFLEEYWPRTGELNSTLPSFAQLDKTRIVFTTPDRPMLKNTKGSIRRKLTVAAYAEDFDRVLHAAD